MKNLRNKGFTLVELLAVILILGVLAILIVPKVKVMYNDSKEKIAKENANRLVKVFEEYYVKGSYKDQSVACNYNFETGANNCTDIGITGDLPDSGYAFVNNDGEINGYAQFGEYSFSIENGVPIFLGNCGIKSDYDYTGHEETISTACRGYYKLEVWGAQGGTYSETRIGGYGGYSQGIVNLQANTTLYVNVGGQGASSLNNVGCVGSPGGFCSGGYNGGGKSFYANSERWGAGGGATHIALSSGTLASFDTNEDGVADSNEINNILIVAGGGGGAYSAWDGGSAGGYIGNSGYLRDGYTQSIGGSQLSGGTGSTSGSFGLGGSITENNGTGGGAGFYGAGSGVASSAGGGSGYIGNSNLINKSMYCYGCTEINDDNTKTVDSNGSGKDAACPNGYDSNAVSKCAKEGNGHVRITYMGTSYSSYIASITHTLSAGDVITFSTVGEHTYNVPDSGRYKLEVWGAQGGSYNSSYKGGYGGYSSGVVNLVAGNTLYVNVGGNGVSGITGSLAGGYNGGGNGYGGPCSSDRYGASGGGATHIAFSNGTLASFDGNNDGVGSSTEIRNIIIVAGGGGGSHYMYAAYGSGASGGGYVGNTAAWTNAGHNYYVQPTGGTQNSGGSIGYSYSTRTITYAKFGQGQNFQGGNCGEGSGGGGGFYGGGAGSFTPGAGGSGYIGNSNLVDGVMYCYGCTESNADSTKTINSNGSNKDAGCPNGYSADPISKCAKANSGYAKITYLGE